ncbi:MAG: beta galactosidase jelly roll domain-containing protein [Acidobacteria bacterium]|nr:beta galactosidase jelly roll domain-containing protein [Acidobacteriota bacterium]
MRIRLVFIVALLSMVAAGHSQARLDLRQGWELQSACKLPNAGGEISTPGFQPKGWIHAGVPGTVVAAQVAAHLLPDPFYGTNLRSMPGGDYPVGKNFANLPMPEASPYACSWWYRTQFALPANFRGKHVALHFDGINYRANIWLNGKQIANSTDVAGMWRVFEFDITPQLRRDKNVLAVEVTAPTETDLALTWVDWAPAPPDKNMGLWRPVYLTAAGFIRIEHPYVKVELEPDLSVAHLTVSAELTNPTDQPVEGILSGEICCVPSRASTRRQRPGAESLPNGTPGRLQAVKFTLKPHETQLVAFSRFELKQPRVWWPAELGKPELYRLQLSAAVQAPGVDPFLLLEPVMQDFGIRQVTSELINGQRLFRINGKPILIRGGGWAPDLLLREDHRRMEDQFRMVRDMGLNTIRLEGKLENDDFFRLADRYGILVMAGWCCCDQWEKWDNWSDENYRIAAASLADQIRRLRQHPSVFVWLNGSDNPPPANVERMYLEILNQYDWPNPVVSSATNRVTEVSGLSGVKMNGPYDYVPPDYWLDDSQRGGAFGLATEISPGPAIPELSSIERFIPAHHLWPARDDEFWKYHSGGGQFNNLNIYSAALDRRYGPANSLSDFLRKSQAAAYEGERAMFEGYARNQWTSAGPPCQPGAACAPWPATGVIQWMLNNAWPSMIWHLYDYYLAPGGGYFGTKKACRPVHVQYSYDDHSVAVVAGPMAASQKIHVSAQVYDLSMKQTGSQEADIDVTAGAVIPTSIKIADAAGPAKTYFLRLRLAGEHGRLLDENFYWLSSQPDVLDPGHGTWYYTPQLQFADLSGLESLPEVRLAATAKLERHGAEQAARVVLRNPSTQLAFMAHVRIARTEGGGDVAPVLWDDNYVSILPGEEKILTGRFAVQNAMPVVKLDGWNIAPRTLRFER